MWYAGIFPRTSGITGTTLTMTMAATSTTYNLGPFFAAYHVRPSTDLDGKTGGECAELIRQALMSIYLQPLHELRSEYNPRDENGELVDWGSVDGAIKWLERVHDYCREHPDYVVRERS